MALRRQPEQGANLLVSRCRACCKDIEDVVFRVQGLMLRRLAAKRQQFPAHPRLGRWVATSPQNNDKRVLFLLPKSRELTQATSTQTSNTFFFGFMAFPSIPYCKPLMASSGLVNLS